MCSFLVQNQHATRSLEHTHELINLQTPICRVRNSFANSLARKGHLGTIAIREEVDDNGKTIGRLEMRVQARSVYNLISLNEYDPFHENPIDLTVLACHIVHTAVDYHPDCCS
jgi:hypothetical protein